LRTIWIRRSSNGGFGTPSAAPACWHDLTGGAGGIGRLILPGNAIADGRENRRRAGLRLAAAFGKIRAWRHCALGKKIRRPRRNGGGRTIQSPRAAGRDFFGGKWRWATFECPVCSPEPQIYQFSRGALNEWIVARLVRRPWPSLQPTPCCRKTASAHGSSSPAHGAPWGRAKFVSYTLERGPKADWDARNVELAEWIVARPDSGGRSRFPRPGAGFRPRQREIFRIGGAEFEGWRISSWDNSQGTFPGRKAVLIFSSARNLRSHQSIFHATTKPWAGVARQVSVRGGTIDVRESSPSASVTEIGCHKICRPPRGGGAR